MKARKSRTLLLLVLLVSMTLTGLWPVAAQNGEPPRQAPRPPSLPATAFGTDAGAEFKPGEVLVKFKDHVSASSVDSTLARYQATRLQTLAVVDVEVWQVPEGQELAIVDQLSADSLVEYAEPNYRYYAFGVPNDPNFSKQWGLTKVQAPGAWDITTGSTGITIAIIDSGIDAGHPDLAGKIVAGYDFVADDSDPRDEHGHGTHVAGIAAAITNNGVGGAGMNWNARIMPVRVLDRKGQGYNTDITAGITWAWQHGAKVINLSLGGPTPSTSMQDAVNAAHAAGSLVVAAMGNCRTAGTGCPVANPTNYPAAYNNVMAVAATGPGDVYAPYSQYGAHCDIAAPGGDMTYYHDPNGIYSTMPTYAVYLTTDFSYSTNYDFLNGTSQAAPFVSGLAALVWATNPSLSPDQVQAAIQNTAVDLGTPGRDATYGWGRINALAAVQVYGVPSAPTLYAISNADGDGSYLVDWNDVAGATSYVLQEDDSAVFSTPTTIYNGPNSQYSVTGQAPGVWYYRVLAHNAAGDSAWSSIQSAAVKPNAPTLNPISNGSNQDEYLVSWSAPAGATSYTLQEANNGTFTSPRTRYMGTAVQYQVTGQAAGTWYYRVLASNVAGDSAWSNVQSTTVDPRPLPAPTLSAISNPTGGDTYLVDWLDVTGATSYILEQSRDPWFSAPTVAYTGAASQHSVTNQPKGTWYYRVRASGATGQGPWSGAQSTSVISRAYLPLMARGIAISQGFESGVMPPSGWTQIIYDTRTPTTTWYIDSGHPYAGAYDASCDYDPNLSLQNEVLLSPAFKASSVQLQFYSFGSLYWCRDVNNNCDLNVWLVVGAWGGGDDIFVYRADGDWAATFIWSPSNVDLTPYLPPNTPVRVGFQYYGQDGAQISLDSIEISGN
jgi:thermitase